MGLTIKANEPLVGDIDLAALLREIPSDHVLKGMFFTRYAASLSQEWSSVEGELTSPPSRGEKYHAFEFYPLTDYLRLFDRVARARFPGATREAYRLLARGEVDVFADSTLGKVTLALLRDPGGALMRYPETFGVLAKGPEATSKRLGDRAVRISFTRYAGAIEYAIGVLEGLVIAFEETPTIDLDKNPAGVILDVSW